jgi:hypothetical protein
MEAKNNKDIHLGKFEKFAELKKYDRKFRSLMKKKCVQKVKLSVQKR